MKAIYKVDAVAGAFSEEGNRLDIAVIPVRITPDDAWYDFNSPFAVVDGTLLASYASMEFPT